MLSFEGGESAPVIIFCADAVASGSKGADRPRNIETRASITVESNDYRISFVTNPDGYQAEFVERGAMMVEDIIQ
jgi:hypothetical protein